MRRPPRWTVPFLRELARTGNVRLAAEGAGVDFTTAYQRRKRHGEFAERWEGALAAHQAAAPDEREGEITPPPASLVPLPTALRRGGTELVTRPDGKVIKGSDARWGKRAEEGFLLELTMSGNVRLAAGAAGFSTQAVYKRRLKDRRFEAAWDAAVETGKARVQAYLVEAATRTFDPDELPIGDEREVPKVTIGEAINIARLKGGPSTSRAMEEPEQYDEDYLKEVRERILEKIQRVNEREMREMTERGWAKHEIPVSRHGEGGELSTVWLPPGYRIARDGEAG